MHELVIVREVNSSSSLKLISLHCLDKIDIIILCTVIKECGFKG